MTLLPLDAALPDRTSATQELLVQIYLGRERRRPQARSHLLPLQTPDSSMTRLHGGQRRGLSRRSTPAATASWPPVVDIPLLARSLADPAATGRLPAVVRSAVAFVDAHAAEPIGLAEIAAAAQISPRALQAAFRRHLGTTPLGHLRSVRLSRVHADLLAARPGDGETVSAAANRWGFSQLSRFGRAYRRRYGVTPRQTLGRTVP